MDINQIIGDKSVALVGGADNIDWDSVNKADLVARVNSHWARQGGHCDILYFSCAACLDYRIFTQEELLSQLKFIMINLSHSLFGITEHAQKVWDKAVHRGIPYEFYYHAPARAYQVFNVLRNRQGWDRELSERYDFHPLTGVLATEHLLLSSAKEVFVTGMNLYQSGGVVPDTAGAHSIPQQIAFFRDALKNPRLKLDSEFEAILQKQQPFLLA